MMALWFLKKWREAVLAALLISSLAISIGIITSFRWGILYNPVRVRAKAYFLEGR